MALTVTPPQHPGFVFGTASAAYQYEGATDRDGRGPSIWDDFCSSLTPAGEKQCDGNARVAVDQYNLIRLREDIEFMKQVGTSAYRLSLAWSRILPTGSRPIEPRGIEHYRRVFGMLRANGIEPYVTMFHFDLPLQLEKDYGGWLNASIIERFVDYAEVCFSHFGDLVSHWMTINEAHTIATAGYLYGVAAPGRCSNRSRCAHGNGTIEPYAAAHNMLLSHARVVEMYRRKYQPAQHGSITMVFSGDWTEPMTAESVADARAAQRRQEFQIGWFADPIYFGDYPDVMKKMVGDRLPRFTKDQREMLRGSADYFALNHYTSRYAQEPAVGCAQSSPATSSGWDDDQCCFVTPYSPSGEPIGPQAGSDWLYSVPWGMRRLLVWVGQRYRVPIVVTENGCDDVPGEHLDDHFRINYLASYLQEVRSAMELDRVDVRGYFVWSLLDNFEWNDGYQKRFGLVYVDDDGDNATLQRVPKKSAHWLQNVTMNWNSTAGINQTGVAGSLVLYF